MSMKNNRLQPFSGFFAISRPFRVFDMGSAFAIGKLASVPRNQSDGNNVVAHVCEGEIRDLW
jgi:hypothetical protein